MDALKLLKQDHQKVKELFEQCQAAKDKKRQKQIFKEIKTELETHTPLEETIFYPAIEEYEELKDMVLESLEEHKQVKTVLREMSRLSPSSERFKLKFKVLKDDVEPPRRGGRGSENVSQDSQADRQRGASAVGRTNRRSQTQATA